MPKLKLPSLVPDFEHKEEISLRDYLALERTKLANERTLLTYVRTSLYMVLAGIAFLQMDKLEDLTWVGYVLFGTSALAFTFGTARFLLLTWRLQKYYDDIDLES
ncbi:putative membrane protein [Catalinimonas alkaloidigena]|uniref:Putative membrane protein n=1 Tax=Catalinimonas alkaloidigena TaxID=1075417 RepID=A0A1G8ZVZ9_9BACT|nr:DUF202 domain-containing protein [Catalinimonas alkaloidigena]SDK19312.1 putative membrane protein [Catalinimonas alkaloidigena]